MKATVKALLSPWDLSKCRGSKRGFKEGGTFNFKAKAIRIFLEVYFVITNNDDSETPSKEHLPSGFL